MTLKTTIRFFVKLSLAVILMMSMQAQAVAQVADAKSQLLYDALKKENGGLKKLAKKKDVEYTYFYNDKSKGTDKSTERYIFNGEQSWAKYTKHPVNVLPDQKGIAVQSLVDNVPMLTLDGKKITDPKAIGGTVFLRQVNLYWFAMMYKLQDPSTISKYIGQEEFKGKTYDKVNLSYDSKLTGKEVNDEYVLYFNPETHLVDLFYFSLPVRGINKPIIRMECDYEEIDGILLTTKRRAYAPDQEGKYNLIGEYTSKNVKFKNKFKKADFML